MGEKMLRGAILLLWVMSASAWAAPPDPVEFAFAVERGDLRTVKRWLDGGLDPDYQGDKVGTGLMIAAWNGNLDMMKLFVERGANPQLANRNGEQPLQLAAWGGHLAAVSWLLDNGGLLNRPDLNWGALHYAVFNGHDKLARYLVERGAEINARSPNGSTPLMLAAREGREAMTRVLLEAGGDPKAKNDWGDTALVLAMRYDHYRVGKMISSPEEFAIAVKAPKESFGEPSRALPAPSQIEEILSQIRLADAEGRPTEDLRKQLAEAVSAFKRPAVTSATNARRPAPRPFQPKSIDITARRGQPGAERAELLVDGKPVAKPDAPPAAIRITPARPAASPAQISSLVRQIRLAEAQGRPADELKQQLYDLVEGMKK